MELNNPINLTFMVNAFLGAISADAMPYVDMFRYSEEVTKITTEYAATINGSACINQNGLYEFIKDYLKVEDIGTLPLPFYASINGYRCRVYNCQSNAASSDYVIQYEILDTGKKQALLVTDTGDCNDDDNYALADIYPF